MIILIIFIQINENQSWELSQYPHLASPSVNLPFPASPNLAQPLVVRVDFCQCLGTYLDPEFVLVKPKSKLCEKSLVKQECSVQLKYIFFIVDKTFVVDQLHYKVSCSLCIYSISCVLLYYVLLIKIGYTKVLK